MKAFQQISEEFEMIDYKLSSFPTSSVFRDSPLRVGQRVRVIRGSLLGLQGVVASTPRADGVLIRLCEEVPGSYIHLSPRLLEAVEQ